MMIPTAEQISAMLADTRMFFSNVHHFECTVQSIPGKSHRGVTITHQHLLERRAGFVRELRNTMSGWVFSKEQYHQLLARELELRGGDVQNAASNLHEIVHERFRKGQPNGQFGELLLFNVIQHFFEAPPLLRKMQLTTNPKIERHGADAIHYRPDGDRHVIFVGEAKTYASKYKFKEALTSAINSVFGSFQNISSELSLYIYNDFIDPALHPIAEGIKNNTIANIEYEIVCVVSYCESEPKTGIDEASIKARIEEVLNNRLASYDMSEHEDKCQVTLGRFHYLVVPIWGLDAILKEFDA